MMAVGDISNKEFNYNSLERDLGKRPQIWTFPVNQHDKIRRAYISLGPYQFHLDNYPFSSNEKNPRKISVFLVIPIPHLVSVFTYQRCCLLFAMLSFRQ